jgi:ribose transport system substrate-binding protein
VIAKRISTLGIGAVLAVTLVCLLAACGSSDSSSDTQAGSGTTSATTSGESGQLKADVEKMTVRPTSIGITTPIKGGVPKGKKIVYLQCAFPDCVQIGEALKVAASKVGWSIDRIGIGTSPQSIAAGWQEALHRNPDGIVNTGAYPQAYYQSEMSEALKRKIPLVSMAEGKQGSPWTLVIGAGESLGVTSADLIGKYVASKITEGHVLAVTIPGVAAVEKAIARFEKKIPEYCPKCSVDVLKVPPASIGTDAGAKIASHLRAHPDTKFVFLSTIDLALGLDSALASAGIQPVPTISATTSAVGLDAIKKGKGGLEATTAYPNVEGAYRAIDGLARHIAGQ